MSYKDWKYSIIAVVLSAGQFFFPVLLHTFLLVIWVIVSLWSVHFAVSKRVIFLITPFVFLIPFGLINSWQWEVKDVFRDWWYVLNPIFILLAGWFFSERIQGDLTVILKSLVISGFAYSLYHFYGIRSSILEFRGGFDIRALQLPTTKAGGILPVIALSVLLYAEFSRFVDWKMKTKLFIIFVCAASLIFSASRSWFLAFVILSAVLSLLKIKKRRSIIIFTIIAGLIVSYFIILVVSADQTFCSGILCRLYSGVRELLPRDYFFVQDLNQYWRGYETYVAIEQYKEGSAFELFFGQGLGALVDLKVSMVLGAEAYDKVPILHNGYAYLLVKFGLVGLFIYVAQCWRYFSLGLSAFSDTVYEQRLLGAYIISLCVIILILTLVIAGFFNKRSMVPALFFLAAFMRARFYTLDKIKS